MRTRVSHALLAVRGLVDETALAAPLPVLLPCVCGLVDADLGLWTAIGAATFGCAPVVRERTRSSGRRQSPRERTRSRRVRSRSRDRSRLSSDRSQSREKY